jgi:hypothetical protein
MLISFLIFAHLRHPRWPQFKFIGELEDTKTRLAGQRNAGPGRVSVVWGARGAFSETATLFGTQENPNCLGVLRMCTRTDGSG